MLSKRNLNILDNHAMRRIQFRDFKKYLIRSSHLNSSGVSNKNIGAERDKKSGLSIYRMTVGKTLMGHRKYNQTRFTVIE